MARAGSEEQVLRKLHKAGSIDATALLPDVTEVIGEINAADAATNEE